MVKQYKEEGNVEQGGNVEANLEELYFQNKDLQNKNTQLSGALSSGSFNDADEQNLIHYQLETDKILERIEHFLKGDQVKFSNEGTYYTDPTKNILVSVKKDNKKGITYYIQEIKEYKKSTEFSKEVLVKMSNEEGDEIDIYEKDSKKILEKLNKKDIKDLGYRYITVVDEDKKPFNDYGVAELMRVMSMYITKETFLSYYEEDRIYEILSDLGDSLNNFLYCNYEKMGMDTKFKESKYTLICLNLLHTVESCYRRAIGGEERENIKTRAIVTQNDGFSNNNMQRSSSSRKKWNLLNPSTW